MNRPDLGILLTAFVFLIAGCRSSEESRRDEDAGAASRDRRISLSEAESRFNPSDYDDELETVQRQHVLEQQRAANDVGTDSVIVESEPSQGYRIQIFATSNIDEANAMRQTAVSRVTEDSVYIVYDPPVYKVRVGDYRTRAEASQKLGIISSVGFTDAWVVSDRIMIRKTVRVPPSLRERRE